MIPKIIHSNSFDFGDPAVRLVPLHSRGVDAGWMKKHASHGVFHGAMKDLRPEKGRTVIHVIAVGDEEIYGPNRNCDGFSRADNTTAHTSFKELGHVFKHHQNTDPLKAVGDVIQTAHHNQMSRIELLLGLDNEKCSREVQALEKGEDLPVSMGSMQDYDVCSICDNKAPTADKHCDHIKQMLGSVFDDGRKVYMKNPNPKYFDISLVFKPADRIAYTLRKVAADNGNVIGGHELAEMFGIRPWYSPKTATLQSLAALYKRTPLELRKVTEPESVGADTMKELKKQAALNGVNHLLAFLHANGWLLCPGDFGELIGHRDRESCEQAVDSYDGIDQLLSDDSELTSFDEPAVTAPMSLPPNAVEELNHVTSMDGPELAQRTIRISITKQPKLARCAVQSPEAWGFSALYNQYKLAFATHHQDRPAVLQALATTF